MNENGSLLALYWHGGLNTWSHMVDGWAPSSAWSTVCYG